MNIASPSSPSSSRRASYILFFVVFLICFLVSEMLVRRFMFGSAGWSYTQIKSVRHIGRSGLLRASAYQDILWELKPNMDSLYKLKPFHTNADGLRDKDYSKTKPPGVFRVAVIGDSYTMGEGVAMEDIYHTVLEDRFNAEPNAQPVEFINFGVAGYSLPQYIATIKHRALDFHPDLIFIGFCAANDSKKPNLDAFNHPYNVKSPGNGFLHSYFVDNLRKIYKLVEHYLKGKFPGDNADEAYTNDQFVKLAELTSANHLPVVVAYIDNKKASADYEMVRKAAERNGFTFIDGTTGFGRSVKLEHAIYSTDFHPSGAANHVMADTLYQELKQRHLIGNK